MSNILLDKLEKELESRGHRSVRYADDICVFVKSERGAERVLNSVSGYKQWKFSRTRVKMLV